MGANDEDSERPFSRIARVRCLGCGVIYVKPSGGGTVSANPGCPECGYVGWVQENSPVNRNALQFRSAGDHLRRRTG